MSTAAARTVTTDSSAIDNALIALLGSDPELLQLCPNGVYYDEAPPGSTRFVIVSLVQEVDVDVFGGNGYEDALYTVEARMLSNSAGDIRSAAARIHTLLQDQPLVAEGFTYMAMYRETRVRITEVDEVDVSIRWNRRGGHYRVQMTPS
jgi:hypothetical protein